MWLFGVQQMNLITRTILNTSNRIIYRNQHISSNKYRSLLPSNKVLLLNTNRALTKPQSAKSSSTEGFQLAAINFVPTVSKALIACSAVFGGCFIFWYIEEFAYPTWFSGEIERKVARDSWKAIRNGKELIEAMEGKAMRYSMWSTDNDRKNIKHWIKFDNGISRNHISYWIRNSINRARVTVQTVDEKNNEEYRLIFLEREDEPPGSYTIIDNRKKFI